MVFKSVPAERREQMNRTSEPAAGAITCSRPAAPRTHIICLLCYYIRIKYIYNNTMYVEPTRQAPARVCYIVLSRYILYTWIIYCPREKAPPLFFYVYAGRRSVYYYYYSTFARSCGTRSPPPSVGFTDRGNNRRRRVFSQPRNWPTPVTYPFAAQV